MAGERDTVGQIVEQRVGAVLALSCARDELLTHQLHVGWVETWRHDTIGFWWSVSNLDYFIGYTDTMAQQRITDLLRYTGTYIAGKPRVTNVLLSGEARRSIGLTEKELLTPVTRPLVRP